MAAPCARGRPRVALQPPRRALRPLVAPRPCPRRARRAPGFRVRGRVFARPRAAARARAYRPHLLGASARGLVLGARGIVMCASFRCVVLERRGVVQLRFSVMILFFFGF